MKELIKFTLAHVGVDAVESNTDEIHAKWMESESSSQLEKAKRSVEVLLHYVKLLSVPHNRDAFDNEMESMGMSYDMFHQSLDRAKEVIN